LKLSKRKRRRVEAEGGVEQVEAMLGTKKEGEEKEMQN